MITKKYLNELTYEILGGAIEVHKTLGVGLLESVYHSCLKEELLHRKINFLTEMRVPLVYKGKSLETELRCDLFVENCIVIELKALKELTPMFEAQLLTYMKLLSAPKGILINFHSSNIFHEGQQTFVNDLFSRLPQE